MKTASFFTYSGVGRVSIARFAPRGTPAGFKIYKPLAPGSWFNSVSQEVYRELYFAQLDELEPAEVLADLMRLAGDGIEPVLLCYEKPPFHKGNWCHRTMVAEWFLREINLVVGESPHR